MDKIFLKSKFYLLFILIVNSNNIFSQTLVKNSLIEFYIKNLGVEVKGRFDLAEAKINFDENNLEQSEISGFVYVNSINTGIGMRDNHLLSMDYFYSSFYPKITIKSKKFFPFPSERGKFVGLFEITIKAIKKDLSIVFEYNNNTLKTEFELNRLDFGVGGSSLSLSDNVKIKIQIDLK